MSALVVNLYAGPGTGKSTTAAHLFARLKDKGLNVELATEYAKDLTWQESFNVLDNQIYVFAKQQHRLWRLKDKVDIIITDAPLINTLVYNKTSNALNTLVLEEYQRHNNLDIFLNRVKPYNPKGRSQTEVEAKVIDELTKTVYNAARVLMGYKPHFDLTIDGNEKHVNVMMQVIMDKL